MQLSASALNSLELRTVSQNLQIQYYIESKSP